MNLLLGLLGAPLWIIWFTISPHSLGRNAFDGFLRQQGISKVLLPDAAKNDLVANALRIAQFVGHGKGTMAKIAEFTQSLETEALVVACVLLEPDRSNMMLRNAEHVTKILDAHSVRYPPITVSKYG